MEKIFCWFGYEMIYLVGWKMIERGIKWLGMKWLLVWDDCGYKMVGNLCIYLFFFKYRIIVLENDILLFMDKLDNFCDSCLMVWWFFFSLKENCL